MIVQKKINSFILYSIIFKKFLQFQILIKKRHFTFIYIMYNLNHLY